MVLAGRGREKGKQGIFLLFRNESVPWRKEHEADAGPALSFSSALSLVTFASGSLFQQELLCAGSGGCGVTGGEVGDMLLSDLNALSRGCPWPNASGCLCES